MSKPTDLNSNTCETRLGGYLIEAGLITPAQVSVVLNDQRVETDMRFGEVLVARGWVKLETIEFIMTRVVEPERRATHDRNLAESLTESLIRPQNQTQASQAQKTPPYPAKHFADFSTETLVAQPVQTAKPTPPPYPTTPPVMARAHSLEGDFEFEILDSQANTGSLSGASKSEARRNDRKPLPSVSEDGGVNWAG